eukprot:GEMP01053039.1.p1 GENE.GEMP01053039.1~~GEMP01053039.1.p1  ORF type:complete len:177 (+),score=56.00 GEMP01053039.1:137-667(+)
MRQFPDTEFAITWLPFQLDPTKSKQGTDKMESYEKKFGAARMNQMIPQMMVTGRQDGIEFSYGGKIGNTFDSHRLISLALKQGKQDALVEELFKNYFEQEKLISADDVLIAAADKVGLAGARELLAGDAEADQVHHDLRTFAAKVSGVPFFIINDREQLSGAQDPAAFIEIFKRLP